jgi:beta-glucanase (GH16 family)
VSRVRFDSSRVVVYDLSGECVAERQSVYTRQGFDGNTWNLVFSDEFNKDGRSFYNGDDPFFEAVDFHYWPTG